ncbi:MAG: GDSL-type esterase/lipase family protein, partial [Candidatus Methylacidiphilales bacterium]|nr:GDSL-type esterase/lipase family protein [Candidatus Methylacidiphilales bacterium]
PAQAQTLAAGISAAGKNTRARFNPALTRVILPLFPAIQMVSFEGDIEPPVRSDIPARHYLAYGSSITHGAYTPLGTATYPAIIAQQLGTDVSNLGLGGGAHLEPEMADWLAERQDWDFASLELGINLLGGIEVATFRSRVRRFLTPFADDSPLRNVRRRPVICLDVLCNARDVTPGHKDRDKAESFRNVVSEEVAALNCPWISHAPFRDAVSISALSDDLLHPSSAGFEEIGRHLANEFRNVPGMAELLGNS